MPKEEANEIMMLLEQVQKLLDDLIKYRRTIENTIIAVESKIGDLERRVIKTENEKTAGFPKEMEVVINVHSQIIAEHTKDLEMTSEAMDTLKSKIDKSKEELDKKYQQNLKFEESLYVELKNMQKITEEKLKGIDKEITKARNDMEGNSRIIESLKNFIKAVIE